MGQTWRVARAAAVAAGLALTAMCGGGSSSQPDGGRACAPGQSIGCVGPGGCTGFQVCNSDGSAFGACACEDASVGGSGSSGASGSSSGTTSSGSSGEASSGADAGGSSGASGSSSGSGDATIEASTATDANTPDGDAAPAVVSIDDCPGSLGTSLVTALQDGGTSNGAMKWLYPYDGTVFPRGVPAPLLQWSQTGTPSGVYLHIASSLFDYKGCFAGSTPLAVQVPAAAWSTALAASLGASDPLTVELTTSTAGTVTGPLTETWTVALGALKGVVYFDTYTSPQVGNNGAVMMLRPGQSTPTPLLAIQGQSPVGPCVSCHSLSGNGAILAAQRHFYPGGLQSPGSMTFDLTKGLPNATNPTPLASSTSDDWGLSAVYPDGSRLLTAGEPEDSTSISALFPAANANNPGMIGVKASAMYSATTGSAIPFTGLSCTHAMMPSWSPDGKKIVFNDVDNHGGHALVVQDFNPSTNAFSNATVIYDDSSGNYPGWPAFTPDSASVVFALGPASNFASIPPSSFSSVGPVQAAASDVASSDLYIVPARGSTSSADAGTAAAQPLALANGYRNGSSYLPFPGRDEHLGFYPTVSPVAAGGYCWVVFTSRRQYGSAMVDTTNSNAVPDPVFHGETKKIWVTALSIGGSGDPSHPAFYLPGQEAASGAIRPVSALAPCAAAGHSCAAGVECCTGVCVAGTCGTPTGCAAVDDRCTTPADCCDTTNLCLGGYCATATP